MKYKEHPKGLKLSSESPQPTVGEQRLGQFPEEGLEQAADHVQVLPPLWRQK